MNKSLIYLASPHSHQSSAIREDRYKEALKCNTWLVKEGYWCYSPIVSNHYIEVSWLNDSMWSDSKHGWNYWKDHDTEMIKRCDELWVLMINGTKESVGVNAEIEIALSLKKIVMTIHEVKFPFKDKGDYDYSILDFKRWDKTGC